MSELLTPPVAMVPAAACSIHLVESATIALKSLAEATRVVAGAAAGAAAAAAGAAAASKTHLSRLNAKQHSSVKS